MARKPKQPTPAKVQPSSESLQAASVRAPQTAPAAQTRAASVLFSTTTSKALSLVVLAAIYAPLSQLILSPVFGSIPSALYHRYGIIGSSILAFALRGALPPFAERVLPLLAFWIPSIQYALFCYSTSLGNPLGPLVTELLTCYPLITLTLYTAARIFDDVDLTFLNSDTMQEAAPSMTFYMLFTIVERIFKEALPRLSGLGFMSSRIGLQTVIAMMYGLVLPQSLFWPALPSIGFTMIGNVHNPLQRTTEVLNNTLALHNYKLLERHESLTGYISVLEDNQRQFRVMRCDHSLLGGEWLEPLGQKGSRKVAEPIYTVFTMMEAVRLVETPKIKVASSPAKKALNIGLGIGTAPSALIAHGVNTTIIELDPIVHYFAGKYFNLPKNHTYYIGDAVAVVEENAQQPSGFHMYDYILHDVFTGGAVPTALFTYEFLSSLSKMLREDGTIAINYAGDLNLHAASMIHRTIASVFPNCRTFREEPESESHSQQDFTNLVYFCAHPGNDKPIRFRKPVAADYLGSGARQQSLLPKHELDAEKKFNPHVNIISRGSPSIKELETSQAQSAIGHWHLMRTVIPDVVWENW